MMKEKFLNYLRYELNRSQLTVESYGADLSAFETYFKNLDDQLSWESVDADVIRDWMESMMDKGNTATSINRRLSALRSLYRFALSRHLVARDPAHGIAGPKKEKPLPQFVREKEMDAVLEALAATDDYKSMRARTIILLFYTTGIRLAELIGLDDGDVDYDASQIKVTGKRDKQRLVPFGEELKEALRKFQAVRDQHVERQSPAFFLSDKGLRMTRAQVEQVVKENLTGFTTLKKRSPHVLRHTFATAMLNHDAGIESVQKLLGHESLSTTQIYTHTTFEQLRQAYVKAHPRTI